RGKPLTEKQKKQFSHLIEAFKYGVPPHGGIALGFDRLVAMLCGSASIRDVIAFPKTMKGACLMTQSPGKVEESQLRDLHLTLNVKKETPSPEPLQNS
ncbi:MAG: hypothetical protein EOM12_10130, partial [Verrucomicrobiae bacterium]|nr:hypothetical protein [Verrucomicrobiae bacterium]